MNNQNGNSGIYYRLRRLSLFGVIVVGFVVIIGSGGGSGGGGGGTVAGGGAPGSGQPGILPLYQYLVAGVGDGITVTVDGGVIRINADTSTSSGLSGELVCNTTTEECAPSTIDSGSGIDVFDVSATLFGHFQVRVKTQMTFAAVDDRPTSGSLEITSVTQGIVSLNMVSSPAPGVQIFDDSVDKGTYTWQEFYDLGDASNDPALQLATFAVDIFLFSSGDMMNIAASGFDLIEEIDKLGVNSMDEMCPAFSNSSFIPPVGYVDQGMMNFQWIDDNPGDVGHGDSFRMFFTDCWDVDDQSIDNGGMDMVSYTEVTNANNIITRIGFEGSTQGKTGGVFFDNFTSIDIGVSTPGQPLLIDSVATLEGGFTVVFFEP